jgi:hypothetical protein
MMGDARAISWHEQEQLDSALGELFSKTGDLSPEERALFAATFLEVKNLKQISVDADVINELLNRLGLADITAAPRREINKLIGQLDSLDYLSTSYWSPAIPDRQSAVACDQGFHANSLRKRCAIAFFDITWDAEQRGEDGRGAKYWSLAHYLAKHAPRPWPTLTIFETDSSGDDLGADDEQDAVIRINLADGLPFANAITDHVKALAKKGTGDDNALLEDCLRLGRPSKGEAWLVQLRESYQDIFHQAYENLSGSGQWECLQNLTVDLRKKYRHKELTKEQVAFMMAMQVLWRAAFGGRKILYAFPTIVNTQRCILTAGASRRIEQRPLLTSFGRSLFSNLLFLDYGSKRGTQARRAYQSFVAHNLPHLVFAPASAELQLIKRKLDDGFRMPNDVASVNRSVAHLESLFGHYESLMGRLRSFNFEPRRSGERDQLDSPGLPTRQEKGVSFNNAIRPSLLAMFEVLRDRVLDPTLRERLQADFPEQDLWFDADVEVVTEILVNLVSNAIDAIDPRDVEKDIDRAVVSLRANRTADAVCFTVQDFGAGFPSDKLKRLRALIESFDHADRDRWRALVDEILDNQDATGGVLERSGLGLPLSIAYLSQLRWDREYGKQPGHMTIVEQRAHSKTRRSTAISITISQAYLASEYEPDLEPAFEPSRSLSVAVLTFDKNLEVAWGPRSPDWAWTNELGDAKAHSIVVIDSEFHGEPHPFNELRDKPTLELMSLFRDASRLDELPMSILALKALDHQRLEGGVPTFLVFVADNLATSLVQELIQAGADAICGRNPEACAEQVKGAVETAQTRLARLRPKSETRVTKRSSKRVLVVENNRSVCLSLRKRLEDTAELHFVGSNLRGNTFHVDTDMARKTYETVREERGDVAAIICDLALDEPSEARVQRVLGAVAVLDRELPLESISKTIHAMAILKKRAGSQNNPDLSIIFLSDFTRYPLVVKLIENAFGEQDYMAFPKNRRGFEGLEEYVRSILP